MREARATVQEPYKYKLSGLENVSLAGITVYHCPDCKAEVPIIPRPAELHRKMVHRLTNKPTLLSGREVRFLRKYSGKSAKEFAGLIRTNPSTLSRIENRDQGKSKAVDALIRLVANEARNTKETRRVLLDPVAEQDAPRWQSVVFEPSEEGGWREAA